MKRLPGEIERESFAIITAELREKGICLPAETAAVTMRCIHASADMDYASTLRFTQDAVAQSVEALRQAASIVTDTNMALAGISKPGLQKLGGRAYCFMAEPEIAERAKKDGTTRAAVSVDHAAERFPDAILAVGNAPTALLRIADRIETGLRPALVIGVPVGVVNVVESSGSLPYVKNTGFLPSWHSAARAAAASRPRCATR